MLVLDNILLIQYVTNDLTHIFCILDKMMSMSQVKIMYLCSNYVQCVYLILSSNFVSYYK